MQPSRPRLDAVDLLRGVIMVIMAIDHTRDYFGIPGDNPTNLATTTVALFFTRWITHFCAPVFFLLTGTGAYLSLRKRTVGELSNFLITRGLWLIVLEVTVLRCLAYQFNFDYHVTMLIVIWALGWSMIVLGVLVRLPMQMVIAFGVLLIAGHNAFDALRSTNVFVVILHGPGFLLNHPGRIVFVSYPLIPWIGVTAVGYGLGQVYEWDVVPRARFLVRTGLALIAAFVVLRWINVYGDPSRWVAQKSVTFTLLSFLNTTKYPPSLLFLLMTLGPTLLFLRMAEGGTPALLRPALTIGRVPLFYFILHFAFIHLLALVVCWVTFGSPHWMVESPDLGKYPFTAPPGWGFSLAGVYLAWAVVVIVMYPLCRWFAAVKQRRREAWLSYL